MIVALLGVVISLFAYLIAFPRPEQRRFDVYAALLAAHLLATIAYWLLSFEEAMDAFTYYRDPYNFIALNPLESGTYFIVHVDQTIRRLLGGSFLDHFLFFQCFGMIGLALMVRTFNEVAESLGMAVPLPAYMLLFLPGLHFWSSAIGKDAPMFMAVTLAAWAALRIPKRLVWLALALLVMALIRPHVGAIVLGSVVAALMLSKQLAARMKLLLAPVVLVGFLVVAARTFERFNLELDPESLGNFVERTQGLGERYGSGANLESMQFSGKLFSLLFRPLYFDGTGLMHVVASIENTVLLVIFLYIGFHWKLLLSLFRNVFYMTYATIYSSTLIVLLAMVNYNIGLGQRQKMMAIPVVLIICATIFMYKRHLATAVQPDSQPAEEQVPAAAATGV